MEAAMVAMDPMTGAVRVLVGGRDYYESNFNRATQVQKVSMSLIHINFCLCCPFSMSLCNTALICLNDFVLKLQQYLIYQT